MNRPIFLLTDCPADPLLPALRSVSLSVPVKSVDFRDGCEKTVSSAFALLPPGCVLIGRGSAAPLAVLLAESAVAAGLVLIDSRFCARYPVRRALLRLSGLDMSPECLAELSFCRLSRMAWAKLPLVTAPFLLLGASDVGAVLLRRIASGRKIWRESLDFSKKSDSLFQTEQIFSFLDEI